MATNPCAPCGPCAPIDYPICGGTPIAICVWRRGDAQPFTAWASANCTVPGNAMIEIYADRELTQLLENYSWAHRVTCPTVGTLGTTCGNPVNVRFCDDIDIVVEADVDFTGVIEAINANGENAEQAADDQLAATNAQVPLLTEIEAAINSGNTVVNDSINSLIPYLEALVPVYGFDTDGDPLPAEFLTAPRSYTHDNDLLETESVTVGATTWTRTFTYNVDDELETISGWEK